MLGAGPNAVFAVADAIYKPFAARQVVRSRELDVQSARNDSLFAVATAYFDVQQARGEVAGAVEAKRRAEDLVRRTEQFTPSLAPAVEVNRARTELERRRQSVESAYERWQVASVELVRILRLDPTTVIEPLEPPHVHVELIDASQRVDDLMSIGLTNRPELASHRAIVQATLAGLRQERMRSLIPSLLLRGNATNPSGTLSGGDFDGGFNGDLANFGGRQSYDAQVIWELQNLGLGNRAAVRERSAANRQALLELFRIQDRVAAEVSQFLTQAQRSANRMGQAAAELQYAIETADKNLQETAAQKAHELRLSFEPADIVNEVMSFGSPTPIEVVVSGPKLADNRAYAERLRVELAKITSLRDLQFDQSMDYPTVQVQINRYKAGESGVTANDVAKSIVSATSSSRFTVPNYWRDPATGISYQVQVEIPQAVMRSPADIEAVPVKTNLNHAILLRDVAKVNEGTMPGEFDRYNMRRFVSMTANIEGDDLGRAAARIQDSIRAVGIPPQGVEVDVRGQVVPMTEMFDGLSNGFLLAVVVILLLLWAYYQSALLAVVATSAIPAVMTGVVLALLFTGTTINLQSFMGSIMAVGVSVANSILLVTFAERYRRQGLSSQEAGIAGATSRVRPIVMTSVAMIAGMLPMALGLGEAGDQTSPQGVAVIGGLVASTLSTLLLVPVIFTVVMRRSSTASASIDPFDPESRHFTVEDAPRIKESLNAP